MGATLKLHFSKRRRRFTVVPSLAYKRYEVQSLLRQLSLFTNSKNHLTALQARS